MRAWAVRTWADGFEILTEMMAAKNCKKALKMLLCMMFPSTIPLYSNSVDIRIHLSNTSFEYAALLRSTPI